MINRTDKVLSELDEAHRLSMRPPATTSIFGEAASVVRALIEQMAESCDDMRSDPEHGGCPLIRRGWCPISTAPRDGTHVLVYPALFECALVVSWDCGSWRLPLSQAYVPYEPTHWMAVPEPNK